VDSTTSSLRPGLRRPVWFLTGHFDVVIVDEFHHVAAKSYQELLEHVQPTELLGLTATPESDGPRYNWFDNQIAAELRLWDAIDRQRRRSLMHTASTTGLTCVRSVAAGPECDVDVSILATNDAWAVVLSRRLWRALTIHTACERWASA
jgi:hypothetical protein